MTVGSMTAAKCLAERVHTYSAMHQGMRVAWNTVAAQSELANPACRP